jgi:hypothetical protein
MLGVSTKNKNQTPWRPPLVGEVSANFRGERVLGCISYINQKLEALHRAVNSKDYESSLCLKKERRHVLYLQV